MIAQLAGAKGCVGAQGSDKVPLREAIAASYGSRPRDLFGYDEALDELERIN